MLGFILHQMGVKPLRHSILNFSVVCVLLGPKIKVFKIFIEQLHCTDESQKERNIRLRSTSWPLHLLLFPLFCSKNTFIYFLYTLLVLKDICIYMHHPSCKRSEGIFSHQLQSITSYAEVLDPFGILCRVRENQVSFFYMQLSSLTSNICWRYYIFSNVYC